MILVHTILDLPIPHGHAANLSRTAVAFDIRAAVAAGVIAEIRAGVAPVAAATRGAPSTEYDRPHQH